MNNHEQLFSRLKSDLRFAQDFFYGTGTNTVFYIVEFVRSMILKSYRRDIPHNDLSTLLYEHLYSEGTWSVLDTYSATGSVSAWLTRIAFTEAVKYLHEINEANPPSRTPSNTRCKLKSIAPAICATAFNELLAPDSETYAIMTMLYVERVSPETAAARLATDVGTFGEKARKAENAFRKHVLMSGNQTYESLFIRDKNPKEMAATVSFTKELAAIIADGSDENPFEEVFGLNISDDEIGKAANHILEAARLALKNDRHVNQRAYEIFIARHIDGVPPMELARRYGVDRAVIDNTYSQMRRRFRAILMNWWNEYCD